MTHRYVIKEKLQRKEPVLGCFIGFYAPAVVEMLGYAGFDFIVLDNEHGWFNPSEVENMIRAAEIAGIAPIVRIDYDNSSIQKVLDRGAAGIQVPMVNNKQDAQRVVQRAKFPPLGQRGAAYSIRAAEYGRKGGLDYLNASDNDTLVAVHIETPEAVENFEEIMSVPGIDVAFIGPLDLAVNMGYKAQGSSHPEVVKTVNDLYSRAKKLGVPIGSVVGNAAAVQPAINNGATYVAAILTSVLSETFTQIVREIKDSQ